MASKHNKLHRPVGSDGGRSQHSTYAASHADRRGFAPLTPDELAREAERIDFSPHVPLRMYVRSLDTLYREGKTYLEEKNYAKAYMLLFRFGYLLLEKIDKRPDAHTAQGKILLRPYRRQMQSVFVMLDTIKPYLLAAHEQWAATQKALLADRSTGAANIVAVSSSGYATSALSSTTADSTASDSPTTSEAQSYADFAARDPALSWNPEAQATLLDASDNMHLAVSLANQRFSGQADEEARLLEVVHGNPPSSEQHSLGQPGLERLALEDMNRPPRTMELHEVQGLDALDRSYYSETSSPEPVTPMHYIYPTIAKSKPIQYDPSSSASPSGLSSNPLRRPTVEPPPVPQKEAPSRVENAASSTFSSPLATSQAFPTTKSQDLESRDPPPAYDDLYSLHMPSDFTSPPSIPPRPSRQSTGVNETEYAAPPRPPKYEDGDAMATIPPRPPKKTADSVSAPSPSKSAYTFKPAAYLENGAPIRPVFLPDTLQQRFLRLAQRNTNQKIETCGILCGKLVNNALFVSCLLIPEQVGTADQCETTNEESIFAYCERHDLIQIGWIHTHPTQTCFLSSRDLHTHLGYQAMMDESIAVVCAPKYEQDFGIFRLTKPPGLQHISNCTRPGVFHEHDLPGCELYTDARNPKGHVYVVPGITYVVADLRKDNTGTKMKGP